MYTGLVTLADENIDQLLAYPPLIWKVIAPDDPDIFEDGIRPRRSLLDKLLGRQPEVPTLPALTFGDAEGVSMDLDKAWHGIHYLLTGTDWGGNPPHDFILQGGSNIGDVDVGYGPARAFRAAEAREIHNALAPLSRETLLARYQPERMKELDIYPNIWDFDRKEDDAIGYCADYFAELQTFLQHAAAAELGFVIHVG